MNLSQEAEMKRKIFRAYFILLLFTIHVPRVQAQDICTTPVRTESGMVAGMKSESTNACAWRGVPYAAAPVGELRWKAPQPNPGWSGVRNAVTFGDKCPQKSTLGIFNAKNLKGMSEDCLYLNIYRPKKEGKFPVMVWIHGGGYLFGSGSGYAGDRLSEFGDVVVVTINYRLGVFGFLADRSLRDEDPNKSVGNYGILDMVAAIKWVKANINNFGGDPGNITIFGESAGSWAVCTLLATPLASGLFQHAIMESQGCNASENLEKGYEKAKMISEHLGCAPNDLACLRKIPTLKLVNKGTPNFLKQGFNLVPHHDGYLLSDSPIKMIRSGNYAHVPLLAGYNRDEFDAAVFLFGDLNRARRDQYSSMLQSGLGLTDQEVETMTRLYPLSAYQNNPRKACGNIISDFSIICPTYLGLASVASHQTASYFYRFDYDNFRIVKNVGALHSMEIPFVFNEVGPGAYSSLFSKRDLGDREQLSKVMMGYWTNFARTGNPNGPGLPEWPTFAIKDQKFQVLDTEVRTETAKIQDRCSFFDQYSETHPPFLETLGRPQTKK
jgi:para-nitrobenzyl esterase